MNTPQPVYPCDDMEGHQFIGSVLAHDEWSDMYSKGNTVTVRWGTHPLQASTNELRYAHLLGGVHAMAAKLAGY